MMTATTNSTASNRTVTVKIDTKSSPFQIPKAVPILLQDHQAPTKEWHSFCKQIDTKLFPLEETIAKVKVLNVFFTILYLVIVIWICCVYFLKARREDTSFVAAASSGLPKYLVFKNKLASQNDVKRSRCSSQSFIVSLKNGARSLSSLTFL